MECHAEEVSTAPLAPRLVTEQPMAASTTAATTTSAAETSGAFNSARQAAVFMFQQRTRNLTQLSEMEKQSTAMEAELQEVQSCVDNLRLCQASLAAAMEAEEQRSQMREESLQTVKGVIAQLGEEQQRYQKILKVADGATDALRQFIDDTCGAEARLTMLLSEAQQRTAGRSAVELRGLAGDVRRRAAIVTNHLDATRRSATLQSAAGLLPQLQEWVCGSFAHQPELSGALPLMKAIQTEVEGRVSATATVQGPEMEEDALPDPEATQMLQDLFNATEEGICAGAAEADLKGMAFIQQAVEAHRAELLLKQKEEEELIRQCNGAGICCSAILPREKMDTLQHRWASCLAEWQEWQKEYTVLAAGTRSLEEKETSIALLQESLSASHAQLAHLQAQPFESLEDVKKSEEKLQIQVTAVKNGLIKLQTQETSAATISTHFTELHAELDQLKKTIQEVKKDEAEREEARAEELQRLRTSVTTVASSLQEMEAEAKLRQESLATCWVRRDTLTASLQMLEQQLSREDEEVDWKACHLSLPNGLTSEADAAAPQSAAELHCPTSLNSDSPAVKCTMSLVSKVMEDATPFLRPLTDFLSKCSCIGEAADSLASSAVFHDGLVQLLQLLGWPADMPTDEVLGAAAEWGECRALQYLWTANGAAAAASTAHFQLVKEIKHEIALLKSELTAL